MFGNTPPLYLSRLAVASSANVGPAYALVRRAANVPVAVFVTAIPAAAASLLVTLNLPTGGTIHTSAPLAARIRFVEQFTAHEAKGAPVLFVQRGLGGGSGWHYAYTVPHASRHT